MAFLLSMRSLTAEIYSILSGVCLLGLDDGIRAAGANPADLADVVTESSLKV